MSILKAKPPKLHKHEGLEGLLDIPKFSLRRVWTVVDNQNLELHDVNLSVDEGTLVLSVDAIDLSRRSRLVLRLQKSAIPKSDWTFSKDTAQTYGNLSGRIVSLLVFTAKKKV